MKEHYRELVKHSAVYGVGQILSRVASVLLLPLYTYYLSPADYGTIAILDLTGSILGVLIGGGIVAAAGRYHFEADGPQAQTTVWGTSLALVVAAATLLVAPALALRGSLAMLALGAEEPAGALYFALALPTVWLAAVSEVPDRYLRIQKRSTMTVVISMGGLLLNIALNVYLLSVARWGVAGVLVGNLITNMVTTAVRLALMSRTAWPMHYDPALARVLWRFGWPMVATALLAMSMHQADRYLLRLFVDLDQIGVYSLAYTIGQGLNGLLLTPFAAIWSVVMYEIAKQPDAKLVFARIFEYFVYGLLLILFGVSLFIHPIIRLVAAPEYAGAAELVPIVCLGFVFFSVHAHFSVPAYLAKQSVSLIVVYAAAAVANILFNFLLVPPFGLAGAAWASVAGYVVFSAVALVRYRRIDRIDYPLVRCTMVMGAMVASYAGCRYLESLGPDSRWGLVAPAVVWSAWAAALAYPVLRERRWPTLAATS